MTEPYRTVTRAKFVDACTAFAETLGLDPRLIFFPMVVDQDRVTYPAVIEDEKGWRVLARTGDLPESARLSAQVRVEVMG